MRIKSPITPKNDDKILDHDFENDDLSSDNVDTDFDEKESPEEENKTPDSENLDNLPAYQILQQMIDMASENKNREKEITTSSYITFGENSKSRVLMQQKSMKIFAKEMGEVIAQRSLDSVLGKWFLIMVSALLTVKVFLPLVASFFGFVSGTVITFEGFCNLMIALLISYFPVFLVVDIFKRLYVPMVGSFLEKPILKNMRFYGNEDSDDQGNSDNSDD